MEQWQQQNFEQWRPNGTYGRRDRRTMFRGVRRPRPRTLRTFRVMRRGPRNIMRSRINRELRVRRRSLITRGQVRLATRRRASRRI